MVASGRIKVVLLLMAVISIGSSDDRKLSFEDGRKNEREPSQEISESGRRNDDIGRNVEDMRSNTKHNVMHGLENADERGGSTDRKSADKTGSNQLLYANEKNRKLFPLNIGFNFQNQPNKDRKGQEKMIDMDPERKEIRESDEDVRRITTNNGIVGNNQDDALENQMRHNSDSKKNDENSQDEGLNDDDMKENQKNDQIHEEQKNQKQMRPNTEHMENGKDSRDERLNDDNSVSNNEVTKQRRDKTDSREVTRSNEKNNNKFVKGQHNHKLSNQKRNNINFQNDDNAEEIVQSLINHRQQIGKRKSQSNNKKDDNSVITKQLAVTSTIDGDKKKEPNRGKANENENDTKEKEFDSAKRNNMMENNARDILYSKGDDKNEFQGKNINDESNHLRKIREDNMNLKNMNDEVNVSDRDNLNENEEDKNIFDNNDNERKSHRKHPRDQLRKVGKSIGDFSKMNVIRNEKDDQERLGFDGQGDTIHSQNNGFRDLQRNGIMNDEQSTPDQRNKNDEREETRVAKKSEEEKDKIKEEGRPSWNYQNPNFRGKIRTINKFDQYFRQDQNRNDQYELNGNKINSKYIRGLQGTNGEHRYRDLMRDNDNKIKNKEDRRQSYRNKRQRHFQSQKGLKNDTEGKIKLIRRRLRSNKKRHFQLNDNNRNDKYIRGVQVTGREHKYQNVMRNYDKMVENKEVKIPYYLNKNKRHFGRQRGLKDDSEDKIMLIRENLRRNKKHYANQNQERKFSKNKYKERYREPINVNNHFSQNIQPKRQMNNDFKWKDHERNGMLLHMTGKDQRYQSEHGHNGDRSKSNEIGKRNYLFENKDRDRTSHKILGGFRRRYERKTKDAPEWKYKISEGKKYQSGMVPQNFNFRNVKKFNEDVNGNYFNNEKSEISSNNFRKQNFRNTLYNNNERQSMNNVDRKYRRSPRLYYNHNIRKNEESDHNNERRFMTKDKNEDSDKTNSFLDRKRDKTFSYENNENYYSNHNKRNFPIVKTSKKYAESDKERYFDDKDAEDEMNSKTIISNDEDGRKSQGIQSEKKHDEKKNTLELPNENKKRTTLNDKINDITNNEENNIVSPKTEIDQDFDENELRQDRTEQNTNIDTNSQEMLSSNTFTRQSLKNETETKSKSQNQKYDEKQVVNDDIIADNKNKESLFVSKSIDEKEKNGNLDKNVQDKIQNDENFKDKGSNESEDEVDDKTELSNESEVEETSKKEESKTEIVNGIIENVNQNGWFETDFEDPKSLQIFYPSEKQDSISQETNTERRHTKNIESSPPVVQASSNGRTLVDNKRNEKDANDKSKLNTIKSQEPPFREENGKDLGSSKIDKNPKSQQSERV